MSISPVMDGLWSSKWHTFRRVHRILVRGVSNVITTWSCDFEISLYLQLSICSHQIWRENTLLGERAMVHSSSGDSDGIAMMLCDFDELYSQVMEKLELWNLDKRCNVCRRMMNLGANQMQAASLLRGYVLLRKFSYLRLWIVSDHLIDTIFKLFWKEFINYSFHFWRRHHYLVMSLYLQFWIGSSHQIYTARRGIYIVISQVHNDACTSFSCIYC